MTMKEPQRPESDHGAGSGTGAAGPCSTGDSPGGWLRFDRMEAAGSLGDLGTLLPLTAGMIVLNGVPATSAVLLFGLYYIIAGLYFRVPVSVQPMKVIGAYAVGAWLDPWQIQTSALLMGLILAVMVFTGLIGLIRKYTPEVAVRGLQVTVGVMLAVRGLRLIVDHDPGLRFQSLGPIGVGVIIGTLGLLLTFLLLDSRRFPAALVLIGLGLGLGLVLGKQGALTGLTPGFHLPPLLPFGWPRLADMLIVLPMLVLPQLPMTVGNAVISNADLSREYFGDRASRVTVQAAALSMALANIVSFFFGGVPMCHGAGGVAAHYRFGARTAGSNLIIGGVLVVLALVLGESLTGLLKLMPRAILGVLLAFAGLQLTLMIQQVRDRADLLVVFLMLVVGMVTNLAVACVVGVGLAWLVKTRWVKP